MKKYIIEWCNGQKSAMPLTRDQVLTALNNWITKENNWIYMVVKNVKTNDIMYIEENDFKHSISDITV